LRNKKGLQELIGIHSIAQIKINKSENARAGVPNYGENSPKGRISRFKGWGIGTTVWHIDTVGVLIN